MDIQLIPLDQFQNFLLCLSRVLALLIAIPVFAGSQLANRIKIGLAVATALLLFPAMAPHAPQQIQSMLELGILLLNEVILGALIGLTAQLI
ncbi:MAG: flagellar biosynthetic protein FliR, partial [Desulfobacterales bacterium]